MMTLTEQAAYLKGLCEGLDLDTAKPEGKLISKMLELISDMADSISDLEDECAELRAYCEELDEDLGGVETDLYECDGDDDEDLFDEDEDDEPYYEITCPNCGEAVCFDDSLDPSELVCPACGESFDATCDGSCEECGCDCE